MTRLFIFVLCILGSLNSNAQINPPLPAKPKNENTTTMQSTAPVKTTIKGKPQVEIINGISAVKIGTQVWMQKNLDVDRFRNGDTIAHARTDDEWIRYGRNRKPAWCYYSYDRNGNDRNGNLYGKLYNWYAVTDRRGLAPAGWHVPSDGEWRILQYFLKKFEINQLYPGNQLRSTEYWESHWRNKSVTNSTGFTAYPGGYRDATGTSMRMGQYTGWWSTTEFGGDRSEAWFWWIHFYDIGFYRSKNQKSSGYSVRCIKD